MRKGLETIPFTQGPIYIVNKYSMEIAEVKCGQKFPNNRYSKQKTLSKKGPLLEIL